MCRRSFSGLYLFVSFVLLMTISGYGQAKAATIPFVFRIAGVGTIDSPPSPASPVVGTTLLATGEFSPFGTAVYSEVGTLTFGFFSPDVFAIQSVANRFTASFNNGADTFSGTLLGTFQAPDGMAQAFTVNMSFIGGTGLFSGATGLATATGIGKPDSDVFSGSGQITAPGLTAVPEPSSYALLAVGMYGLVAVSKWRTDVTSPNAKRFAQQDANES